MRALRRNLDLSFANTRWEATRMVGKYLPTYGGSPFDERVRVSLSCYCWTGASKSIQELMPCPTSLMRPVSRSPPELGNQHTVARPTVGLAEAKYGRTRRLSDLWLNLSQQIKFYNDHSDVISFLASVSQRVAPER